MGGSRRGNSSRARAAEAREREREGGRDIERWQMTCSVDGAIADGFVIGELELEASRRVTGVESVGRGRREGRM